MYAMQWEIVRRDMMNSWHLAKKNCICAVILCVCGCILYACKPTPDMETGSPDSDAYSEQKYQRPYVMEEESDSEDYLSPITWANQGLCSEINGDWFIEDGDRFAYYEEYELPHEKQFKVTWEISLAEMEGTDKLAQEFNRYHEELYESRKAVMVEHEKEVAAMRPEDFPEKTDRVQYGDSIRTIASFKWGNIFTVMDIEDMADSNRTAVIANFNSETGEKYEFAEMFNTADYKEGLTEIIRKMCGDVDADKWNRILNSHFSFAITYYELLLYEDGTEELLGLAWENIEDILTPEFILDVVRYSNRNNPDRLDTETRTGVHLYQIFEANQGEPAMYWYRYIDPGFHYITYEEEVETDSRWFVDDSDRFAYYEKYDPLHDEHCNAIWEILLAEMKGTDTLAQAVNQYHEELYESQKAQMQEHQEEVMAMSIEDFRAGINGSQYSDDICTMAAFQWGNIFTVVDMADTMYTGCYIVPANFNSTTGERYEFEDLFCTENYRKELLKIIEKEADENEYFFWWGDDLEPGEFSFIVSYHGLLIGDNVKPWYALIKWEDLKDILSPEFVSEVLVYAD